MFPAGMPAAGEALHDILGTVERSQVQGRDPLAGQGIATWQKSAELIAVMCLAMLLDEMLYATEHKL